MLTWLHLSDLQLRLSGGQEVLDALLSDVQALIEEEELELDLVLVTGDVATLDEIPEEEYDLVYGQAFDFFSRLQSVTSVPGDRLFFIPGNHDIDQSKFASRSASDSPPWAVGLDAYQKFADQYQSPGLTPNRDEFYVRYLSLKGMRIAILGINTAWMGNTRPYLPAGQLDAARLQFWDQVAIALNQARNAHLKIALSHHSLEYIDEQLHGGRRPDAEQHDQMLERLREECDFILHSHIMGPREPPRYLAPGVVIIDGGSTPGSGPHPNTYNLVQVDFQQQGVKIYGRRYPDPVMQWIPEIAWGDEGVATTRLPPWRPRYPGYFADTPEGDDHLQITPDVNAFSAVFASKQLRAPLCLGLFGEWGAGKTFFMRKMSKRIDLLKESALRAEKARTDSSYYPHIVQIWFNAWHYIDTNLWASLANHIFKELAAAISGGEGKSKDEKAEKAELLRRLEEAKKRRDDAVDEEKHIEERLSVKEEALHRAREERESKEAELGDVVVVVWGEVTSDATVQEELNETSETIGLPSAIQNAKELESTIQELDTFWGKFKASFRTSSQRRSWLLALLLLFVVIPVAAYALNRILNDPGMIRAGASIVALVTAWLAVINPLLKPVWAAVKKLQKLKSELDQRRQERRETLTKRELSLQEELKELREQEKEKQKAREAAQAEVDRVQAEFEEKYEQRLIRFIQRRVDSMEYEKHLGIVSIIHNDFEFLSKLLREAQDPALPRIERIILYIDDLDRCPEDKVMDVLQAVHLLLAFPLFIVVVGVDSRWLLRSLERSYPALQQLDPRLTGLSAEEIQAWESTPQNYLEKIFQIPFNLQLMDQPSVRRLVDDMLSPTAQGGDQSKVGAGEPVSQPPGSVDGATAAPSPPAAESERPSAPETEDIDLTPPSLEIEEWERKFIPHLTEFLPTPRDVRRFVNIYRLGRARIPPSTLPAFVGTEEEPGEFMVFMALLGILAGFPRQAAHVFRKIRSLDKHSLWWDLVDELKPEALWTPGPKRFRNCVIDSMGEAAAAEWIHLHAALSKIRTTEEGAKLPEEMEPYMRLVPQVAQFSFRAGKSADDRAGS